MDYTGQKQICDFVETVFFFFFVLQGHVLLNKFSFGELKRILTVARPIQAWS